jgi:hypothetical protein
MANRFPLIVNATDAKIYELASGDNLDLTSSNIYNNGATIVLPTASGTLATLAGTETLTNKTLSSGTLSGTFAGDHTYSGTITLSATTALVIPVGTTAQRPTASTGQIRFNSSLTSFEGYNGTAWSSLGGVKSVDGFTYILAETSSGASNGELEFYAENAAGTAGVKQGGWNYTRLLTNTPVDFAGSTSGTTRIQATAAASGTLTLPAVTDTLAGIAATQTLTNKSINLANNTLTATSAQIAAAVSDETGSGALVFGTSPSFTTSVLTGSASFNVFNTTATTINAFGAATTLSLGASTGTTTVNNNLAITGNLTVNGTTTTINSTTLAVDDILIELGTVATPTDTTANGGGIVLKGATDKTITWSTTGWTSSEDWNLASGKVYEINGTSVLSASTLGSGVTASSLTSVGTIGTGVWQGTVIGPTYGGTGVNNGSNTITLGGNLTTSGAFATTLTVTAATSVTLPTTGTLATLAGSESLSNKTITSSSFSGTTGSFSGQITSTVATGTAPLVVASTTLVSNLNVDYLDGQHGSYYTTAGNLTGTIPSAVLGNSTAYIGTTAVALNRASANLALTGISSIALPGATSGTVTMTPAATAGTTAITIPATSGTLVTTGDTGTVTSTMIADGTIVNGDISASAAIDVSKLAASTISGVTLGNNLNSLTAGTGLSGTAYNGSAARTWTLAASGVTAGSYGGATAIPVLTIDTYGRVTAASTSSISVGDGTLTLATSGTGISGSASFSANQSGNATFTVTSNATSANTASTIVARDANGDFSAGTVTAVDGFIATSTNPFVYTATTISANVTIPSNYNAMSAGPITINNGVTVTVPDGSTWTIV